MIEPRGFPPAAFFSLQIFVHLVQMERLTKNTLSALFGAGIFLFWLLAFPQALGLQEQNQLFLWSGSYAAERLDMAGGLADWLGEFITQFNCIPWLGALLLALVSVAIQRMTWTTGDTRDISWYPLSFIPSALLLVHMGDHDVLPCLGMAVILSLLLCLLYKKAGDNAAVAAIGIPAGLWLAGPAAWVFVIYVIVRKRSARSLLWLAYSAALVVTARFTLLQQYPWKQILLGFDYFRSPLVHPVLETVTILSSVAVPAIISILPSFRKPLATCIAVYAIILCGTAFWVSRSYDRDTYEVIAYDQLVRNEKWDELVARAEKYQPHSNVSCVSLNLALFMTGNLERMFEFYQCGTEGLLMPNVRDYLSNTSTAEAFWRLGMVNSALRYSFDSQESIGNLRKSGRFMKRMAECQIVNGRYKVAGKYLDILKQSLFYRNWAEEHERFIMDETAVETDPVYAYLRQVRFEKDFLYYYPEMDKMLGILYSQNKNNYMAGYYFMAWKQLEQMEVKK